MKALLINPVDKTVTEIDIKGNLQSFYDVIGCDYIESGFTYPNGDFLYWDEEGKFNEEKIEGAFYYPSWSDVIIGKSIVTRCNSQGNGTNCKSKPSDILNYEGGIQWLKKDEAKQYSL